MRSLPPFRAASTALFSALIAAAFTATAAGARERVLYRQDGWTVATESGSSCYAYIDYPVGTRLVVEIKNDGGDERWYVLLGEHRGRPDLRGRVALRVDGQLVFDGNVTPMRISTGARLGPISEAAVRAISTRTTLEVASVQTTTRYALRGSGAAVKQAYTCATGGDQIAVSVGSPADARSAMFTVKDDVSTGYANMRSGPGLGWPIIAKVPAGTGGLKRVGPCRDRDDAPGPQFCPVNWNGTTGFVSLANLDDDEPPAATTQPNVTASASPAPQPAPASPKSNNSGSGTGFFVSKDGHVLTNAHVAVGCSSLTVALPGLAPQPARLVSADQTNDLALIYAPSMQPTVVPALSDKVRVGETIAVYGFPYAGLLSSSGNFTKGDVSAVVGLRQNSGQMQITAPVQPGNSGGPVLDGNGNVVGVVVSKLNALGVASVTGDIAQNVNFAIKASVAKNFLEANGVSTTSTISSQPISNPDLADRAKAFTAFVSCRG